MFLRLGLLLSILLGRGNRARAIGRLYQCGGVFDQRISLTSELTRRWWFVCPSNRVDYKLTIEFSQTTTEVRPNVILYQL